MGVTQLWQILAPVEQHQQLSLLAGQTLAVDLSIWVCENQCVKQMQGVVTKPYLRNLFFRISHLTQLGVKLVFVIEGSAPELKWDTMIKRQQSRFPGRQGKQPPQRPAGKQTRRNFNSWLKECCELLEILGIPYVQSKGEAEAFCALLNSSGLVDGCLTNDGDVFLYGATTVYRNFTMNSKDPHVEMYRLEDIKTKLGIDRGGLIALGLLIGCDFVPKGVPGIGVANAVRLLQSLQGQDVLMRLQTWSTMTERDCVDQAEILARRKAIQVPDFPQIKVIDEFLVAKDRCPSRLPQWKRPVPAKLQEFALIKLEWPVDYTMEKILPLITLWDMQDLVHSRNPSVHQHLKPHRIVKTRIRQGEPCFEVEWIKPVTDTVNDGSYYVTIESQDMFSKCFPEMVHDFITQSAENKKKPKVKKKKKKKGEELASVTPSLDNLSFQFERVHLGEVASKLQESVKDLHPSFSEYDETTLTTKAKQPRHLTLSPNGKKPVGKSETSDRRKPATVPFSLSEETRQDSEIELEGTGFVPLSQRVKLRIQNKQGSSNKENEKNKKDLSKTALKDQKLTLIKSPGADLSNMSSLLEDIQNLSLKEAENFRHKLKEKPAHASVYKPNHLPQVMSMKQEFTPASISSRKISSMKEVQKMSSPSDGAFCSPVTYMKHQGGLGDSFEIQKSPYYIENPFATAKSKDEKKIDISSPGFFSRPEPEPEVKDNRSAAEKLKAKLESGIGMVGKERGGNIGCNHSAPKDFNKGDFSGEKLTVDSLMSILNSSGKPSVTPQHLVKQKIATPANQSVLDLESSLSQFGDFQIQNSLLNSLCSSLVQALTPKGVSMTKDEYDKLLNTLNEMDSDEDDNAEGIGVTYDNGDNDEVVCNIDFSELEKASIGLKNMNQKLLIKPIQIDEEDVMLKLSKSARKKLRRRERKREQELETLAQKQNVSKHKEKSKCSFQEQQSRRKSGKSNNSEKSANVDLNVTNKKANKGKKAKENDAINMDQARSVEKTSLENNCSLEQKCSDTTKVGRKESVPCAYALNSKQCKPEEVKEEENQSDIKGESDLKVKKKRKKKKIKKASPMIDISANESIFENYLKKAIENNQRKSSENKIVKASPFMDVSADDTLLELDGLSCKVIGEELDSDLETKLKKKKRLSKEKMYKGCHTSQTNNPQEKPILSINNMMTNISDAATSKNSQVLECHDKTTNNNANTEELHVENAIAIARPEVNDAGKLVREFKYSQNAESLMNGDFNSEEELNVRHECLITNTIPTGDVDLPDEGFTSVSSNFEICGNEHQTLNVNCSCVDFDLKDIVCVDKELKDIICVNNDMKDICVDNKMKEITCVEKDSKDTFVCANDEEKGYEDVNNFEFLKTYQTQFRSSYVEGKEHFPLVEVQHFDEVDNDLLVLNVESDTDDTMENGRKGVSDVFDSRDKTTSMYVSKNGKSNGHCLFESKAIDGELNNGINDNGGVDRVARKDTEKRSSRQDIDTRIEHDLEDFMEMNSLNASEIDICTSKETNGIETDKDGKDEEIDVKRMTRSLNGKVHHEVISLDSSDEEVEDTSEAKNGIFSNTVGGIRVDWRSNVTKSEAIQSPACLADRLKQKLRKSSTRDVLDAFTNAN